MKLEDVQKNYGRVAKRYDRWTELVFGRVFGVESLREHTIDLLGDLDDTRLRANGSTVAVLESRTGHIEEERYLSGGGVILSGTLPNGEKRGRAAR